MFTQAKLTWNFEIIIFVEKVVSCCCDDDGFVNVAVVVDDDDVVDVGATFKWKYHQLVDVKIASFEFLHGQFFSHKACSANIFL